MQEQVYYFFIVLVVLVIALFLSPGQNAYGALRGNLTESRTSVEKLTAGSLVLDSPQKGISMPINSYYNYDITAVVNLKVTPKPDKPLQIIPVINFKNVYAPADENIILAAGEDSYNGPVHQTITARIPPRRFGSGDVTFVEGQECFFRAGGSEQIFLAGVLDIAEKITSFKNINVIPPEFEKTCKAKFFVECKSQLKTYTYLKACDDIAKPDAECSQMTSLCGVDVSIVVDSLDCKEGTATVLIKAEGDVPMPDWKAQETVKMQFFRKSSCVDLAVLNKDFSRLKELCTQDFLGAISLETTLIDDVTC